MPFHSKYTEASPTTRRYGFE